jgi:predicted RNA-binding protein with TRAM domain
MRFEREGRRFEGRRFGERFDVPKPIKVGEEYDVEINEIGSKGDGIARIKNFVVFVNGVKKGEKAHIRITEVRNRFAIGEKTGGEAKEPTEVKVEEAEKEEPTEAKVEEAVEEKVEEEEETSEKEE